LLKIIKAQGITDEGHDENLKWASRVIGKVNCLSYRFNKTTRSLLERVGTGQRKYQESIERINHMVYLTNNLVKNIRPPLKNNSILWHRIKPREHSF